MGMRVWLRANKPLFIKTGRGAQLADTCFRTWIHLEIRPCNTGRWGSFVEVVKKISGKDSIVFKPKPLPFEIIRRGKGPMPPFKKIEWQQQPPCLLLPITTHLIPTLTTVQLECRQKSVLTFTGTCSNLNYANIFIKNLNCTVFLGPVYNFLR